MDLKHYTHNLIYEGKNMPLSDSLARFKIVCPEYAPHEIEVKPYPIRVFDTCSTLNSLQTAEMRCFFVKFYHFICCTGLYLFWNYAIIRYETQL